MKANELRIGNWVSTICGNIAKVSLIAPNYVYVTITSEITRGEDEISGIPLTGEWLEKFGFIDNKIGEFECQDWHEESWVFLWNEFVISTTLKYIHQLQNLYFALTGEELTLNL